MVLKQHKTEPLSMGLSVSSNDIYQLWRLTASKICSWHGWRYRKTDCVVLVQTLADLIFRKGQYFGLSPKAGNI